MKNLPVAVRNKAVEIANALLDEILLWLRLIRLDGKHGIRK
ncbi:hypothetical protein SAMN05660226_01323 [Parapedobacter luteus]|uniref:Uncharacterized protein n=1 Tax=Parapedobacter luteus TaxID=623280 RepID=A0A1T5B423_9SPHI|nr:hypothetical protein SAMN05660226_01323 [Parapedobacter luteus]